MLLCIDIGNSQIHIGFYIGNKLISQLRLNTKLKWNVNALRKEVKSHIASQNITNKVNGIVIASVVPSLNAQITKMCIQHFKCKPLFVSTQVKTDLKFNYNNPKEIGADLICGAIAATELYPNKNLLIIDMGTATTIIAVTKAKEFETGVILPGIVTQINSLSNAAELLSKIDFSKPKSARAANTPEAIKAGIYYGHLGAVELLVKELRKALFPKERFVVVATGGLSRFYKNEKLFRNTINDLVLQGMKSIYLKNSKGK